MARITYNKNVSTPSEVVSGLFSNDDLKYGEIVICNSIDEPGLYIFTKNDLGETKIKKVNSSENVIIEENIDPTASGKVASGDTLMQSVSKLQNQINSLSGNSESESEKVSTIVVGVGLNEDGTYKAIAGDYVATATSIEDAIAKLDSAITTVSGITLQEAKNYADTKITEAVNSLDTEYHAGEGEVVTDLFEVDGIVSGDTKKLSIAKDASGLKYDLKIGSYIFGTIDIPQDQFLSAVTFISAATVQDVAEALNYGQIIELGKPYLKFVWTLTSGVVSPTYVDVSSLIDIYNANDIKLSDNYSKSSFDIKSGTTLEDAVYKITNELTAIEEAAVNANIASPSKTIIIASSNTGTNVDVHIDNETIVSDDSVSKYGELSVKLDVEKQNFDTGYVRSKYTLKSKTGEYGVITDTREILSGSSQFLTVESEPVVDSEGNRTNKTTISPVMVNVDWNDINGMSVQDGNGLATAYEVKQYVKDGIDGDNIFVGNNPVGNLYGRIDFNQSGISYDNVHEAFVRTDNNMVRLDNTIGLATDGPDVHLYPSATTQECLLISADTTIMGALKTLDKAIDNMDWTGSTNENQVFTGLTQKNGHISATTKNIANVKLADYQVVNVENPSASTAKVASTDTLGAGLGKLQGQINAMDWSGDADTTKVFTAITEVDGRVTAATDLLTNRVIGGYAVQSSAKVANTDKLGVALGKLQGQIDALDWTGTTTTNDVFTGITEADGKVSATTALITSRTLSGYGTTADTKVAASDTLGAALGKLQGQIDSMDYSENAGTDKVITAITQVDGKVSVSTQNITERILTGYAVGSDAKISEADSLGGALGKIQGQINAMDKSSQAEANSIIYDVTETDGKVSAESKLISQIKLSGYTVGSDAKIAETDTLGGALGKVQGQINAMDKTASSVTGKFVRTVAEDDGKVSEVLGFIENTDITVCAATSSEIASLGANVKEAYKLVNANGATQLGEWIKIYKDSSISEIYLGTSADTVNATTGVVDKKSGDKESLNYVYYTVNGTYSMAKIDLEDFLTEPEFKSGVTVTNHIAHGVVDGNSEKNESNVHFLTVGADGFKISGIKDAIDTKINKLNSSSATTNAGYYMTGIGIANGKITGITQAQLTAQETELSTGGTVTGNVLTSLTVSDHAITLGSKNVPDVAFKTINGGATAITAASTADTITVTGSTAISVAGDATNKKITISHVDTSNQSSLDAGSGKYIKSVSLDDYGHVTGLTTGNTVNSASTAGNADTVAGKTVGNASGNVPLSNNTVNTDLNADKVDGKHIWTGSASQLPSTKDANTIYIVI